MRVYVRTVQVCGCGGEALVRQPPYSGVVIFFQGTKVVSVIESYAEKRPSNRCRSNALRVPTVLSSRAIGFVWCFFPARGNKVRR